MKHDQPVIDVIPCSFQSGFRRLPTRGLWKTNPCQNSKSLADTFSHPIFVRSKLTQSEETGYKYI